MNYSLKSFFPKNGDCAIHLLQSRNDNEKGQNVCFLVYKKQSQYMCEIFDTNVLLKGLLDKQYQGDSIDSFLRLIGKEYEIGVNKHDLYVSDLVLCFQEHGFTLIDTKTPISDKPIQSGFSGSIYLMIAAIEDPDLPKFFVKIYLDEGIINKQRPPNYINEDDTEQKITKDAGPKKGLGARIGPMTIKTWGCNLIVKGVKGKKEKKLPFRFIVMQRFDINLEKYLDKLSAIAFLDIAEEVRNHGVKEYRELDEDTQLLLKNKHKLSYTIIRAIHDKLLDMIISGIQHNDFRMSNIVLNFKDKETMKELDELLIINFDIAEKIPEGKLFADPTKDLNKFIQRVIEGQRYRENIGFWLVTKELAISAFDDLQTHQEIIKLNTIRKRK